MATTCYPIQMNTAAWTRKTLPSEPLEDEEKDDGVTEPQKSEIRKDKEEFELEDIKEELTVENIIEEGKDEKDEDELFSNPWRKQTIMKMTLSKKIILCFKGK